MRSSGRRLDRREPQPGSAQLASRTPARRLLVGCLVLAALWPLAVLEGPGAPESLRAVALGDGCGLGERGEACDCREMRAPLRRVLGLPVALASARLEDLESLPGIGPVRARSLLGARESGRLDAVPGIGPATREKLRGRLTLGPDPACRLPAPVWRGRARPKMGTPLPPL